MASFAAPLAAEIGGVPSVHFGVGPSFPDDAYGAGQRMAPMWGQWGRQPDELAGMFRLAYFDPFPPSLDNPARSLQVRCYPYQPVPLGSEADDEVAGLPRPPWVWATLGTVFNANPRAWARIADGLKDLGAGAVATVGDGTDLTGLPPFPANFTVLPFAPARCCWREPPPCCATQAPAPCSGPSATACRWWLAPGRRPVPQRSGLRSGWGRRHDQRCRRSGAGAPLRLGR